MANRTSACKLRSSSEPQAGQYMGVVYVGTNKCVPGDTIYTGAHGITGLEAVKKVRFATLRAGTGSTNAISVPCICTGTTITVGTGNSGTAVGTSEMFLVGEA